jgi:endogenous inhibitor of DNA gyrase (YacG/DUF329 family)
MVLIMDDVDSKCIICESEVQDSMFFPFCSERCQMVDLGRWLNEDYSIPCEDEE